MFNKKDVINIVNNLLENKIRGNCLEAVVLITNSEENDRCVICVVWECTKTFIYVYESYVSYKGVKKNIVLNGTELLKFIDKIIYTIKRCIENRHGAYLRK